MSNQAPAQPTPPQACTRITVYADEGIGEVTVEFDSFVALNVQMDRDLDALQRQFASFQTPNTIAQGRGGYRA